MAPTLLDKNFERRERKLRGIGKWDLYDRIDDLERKSWDEAKDIERLTEDESGLYPYIAFYPTGRYWPSRRLWLYPRREAMAAFPFPRLEASSDPRSLSLSESKKQDFTVQLRSLQQHYTILDDDRTIIELLEAEPALYALLIEAVQPLQHAFGDKRIVHARAQSSDEDSILKVSVQLPADFGGDPERALRSFDEEWWLKNCHRSGGALVFDYEMQNAI